MLGPQKKITCATQGDSHENFPIINQISSLKRQFKKHTQAMSQPSTSNKKDNYSSPRLTARKFVQTKQNGKKQNVFNFLSINIQMMNKNMERSALRNNISNISRFTRFTDQKKSQQKKLEKMKKEEWFVVNKKYPNHLSKLDQHDQRKIYRARKKYLSTTDEKFVAKTESSLCLDGAFPMARLNSFMISVCEKNTSDSMIVLVGGSSGEMSSKLHMHSFSQSQNLWSQIRNSQTLSEPHFNLSQHIVLCHKKTLFIIGGIAVIPSHTEHKNQRYSIPFISTLNLKTNKWSRINWNVYLRAHAGTTFGNFGIIDGGVTEDNKNSNKIYLMDLAKSTPPVLVSSKGLGLSYHKMVSTDNLDEKNRSISKADGIFCYGGYKQDGTINDRMLLMSIDYRFNQLFDKLGKFQWNVVQTFGRPPKPRYMHSMDLLQTKASFFDTKVYCTILGGFGENETILNDFWLFDLGTFQWCEIKLSYSNCLSLQGGLAGHSTAVNKNQLFIFGGYNKKRQYVSHFWTISCQKSLKSTGKEIKVIKEEQ